MYYKKENFTALRLELISHVGITNFNSLSKTGRTLVENFETYAIGYNKFWINKRTKAKVFSAKEVRASKDEHRQIFAPKPRLKQLTKDLNVLFSNFTCNRYYIKGFVEKEGVQTNAEYFKQYKGIKFGVNMDLENAFNQIDFRNLRDLAKYTFGWNGKASTKFAKLMTNNGEMVQGNPLSPTILNLFAILMDLEIVEYCKKRKSPLLYTRYADDMLIGSRQRIDFQTFSNLLKIINGFGFKVKRKKTKFMKNRIEITGIILYGGKYWKTKRGKKRKLVKRLRLMKHLQSLGLKNTKRLNKEGKLITTQCVISGIYAWLHPSLAKPGNKKLNKIFRITKETPILNQKFRSAKQTKSLGTVNKKITNTKRQKVVKSVEQEYELFCLSNRHILIRNS